VIGLTVTDIATRGGRRSFQRERPQIERECGAVGPPVSLPHIRCLIECAGKDSLKVSG